MLTVTEIKDVKFSRSVGGYKPDDVDVLLDKIEADYGEFERIIKDYELRVETLTGEIESFKNSQNSIQSVLVSAQELADRIVNDAKEKSAEIIKQAEESIANITAREKELSAAFELKAQEQKSGLEKELITMVETAQKKADLITTAAEDRVKHQQMLFDKLKLEIAAFKSGITNTYKEHLESLSKLPDSVPADPQYISEILSASYDKIIEKSKEEEPKAAEEISSVSAEIPALESEESGFTIEDMFSEEEE